MFIFSIYFYWILWSVYLFVTLFISRSIKKHFLELSVLFFIIVLDKYIIIDSIHIAVISFAFIIFSIALFAGSQYTMYDIICVCTIMIAVAALLLWQKNSALLFIIDPAIVISSIVAFLIVFLISTYERQLYCTLVSIPTGFFLYEFILFSYNIQIELGSRSMFAYLIVVVLIVTCLQGLKKVFNKTVRLIFALNS